MQLLSKAPRSHSKCAPDPYEPLALSCDRHLRIESFCIRDLYDFEHIYRVEMEVVEMPTSHVFDVNVTIFWERCNDFDPQTSRMISIARALLRNHFNASPSPRACGQRWGIALSYPPLEVE